MNYCTSWSYFNFYINPQNLIILFYIQKVKYIIIIIYFCVLYVIIFCLSDLAVTLINYGFFLICVTGENFLLLSPSRVLNLIKCPGF
jgi:hypothetical protein